MKRARPRISPTPYGSLNLFTDEHVGPGSEVVTEPVDVQQDRVSTFGFRTDPRGSWHLDVRQGDSGTWSKYASGTTTGGVGTARTASFEEQFSQARARVSMSQEGTVNVFYGRVALFPPRG